MNSVCCFSKKAGNSPIPAGNSGLAELGGVSLALAAGQTSGVVRAPVARVLRRSTTSVRPVSMRP